MRFLTQVRAVLCSFVGLGRREDMARLAASGNPLGLLVIALVVLLGFLGMLALVARYAAGG